MEGHTCIISMLGRQRPEVHYAFETSLVYIGNSRPARSNRKGGQSVGGNQIQKKPVKIMSIPRH